MQYRPLDRLLGGAHVAGMALAAGSNILIVGEVARQMDHRFGLTALLAGTELGMWLPGVTPAKVLTVPFAALGPPLALK